MPELPEVETLRQSLAHSDLIGESIVSVEMSPYQLRFPYPRGLIRRLKGRKFRSVGRRAKYLLFELDQGVLVNHLGMTGAWRFGQWSPEANKHDHFCFLLGSGKHLIFHDPRRFGYIDFTQGAWESLRWFQHLGPEPLSGDFTTQYLEKALKNRRGPIKSVLMDQKVVVGVGNIYASEALFLARVHPLSSAHLLTRSQLRAVVNAIQKVLEQSIRVGGTSFRDFRSLYGDRGANTQNLCVYDRKNLACPRCEAPIESLTLSGRSTYFCSNCQKKADQPSK